jgi:hypothetical protein
MDQNKYTNKASVVSGANDFTSSLHEAMFQSPTPYDKFVDEYREVHEDSGGNQENIPSSAESSTFKKQADIVMEATPRKHKPVVIIDVTLND